MSANAAAAPATSSQGQGPRIKFANTQFDFGTVDAGTVIQHEFFFTNTGNQLLEVPSVRHSCGCTTTTNWDRSVEPGQVGKVTAQFDSSGFLGGVTKSVFVTCNDSSQTNLVLLIKGIVFQPIEMTPAYVAFSPEPDSVSNETRAVKIFNKTESPVTLSDPVCTNKAFRAELKTIKEGNEFELAVTAFAPFTNRSSRTSVTLKTSCPRMPVLTANCYLSVLPALVINPTQITLATSPLPQAVTNVVTIRNNTSMPLVLSKPEVSAEGVGVELKESQPGRQYSMILTFPSGFKSRPGRLMEARVSSNDPNRPVIKVSIFQISIATEEDVPASSTSEKRNPNRQAKATTASLQDYACN